MTRDIFFWDQRQIRSRVLTTHKPAHVCWDMTASFKFKVHSRDLPHLFKSSFALRGNIYFKLKKDN